MKFLIICNKIISLSCLKYVDYKEGEEIFNYCFEDNNHELYGVSEYVFKEFIKFIYNNKRCFNMDNRVLYTTEEERNFKNDEEY